ncbi:dopamine receptor D4b isoform X1 [Gadus morhua]|uniref:G-protein coupled receptors family 1 profile domain-containing protein n=1 Tax=Gadus morhua TaxID=8049 RepID=A0A8C5AXN2_GADMO|nr:D(4) dopamine receptor-like isoform X1 [Gadus morhua]XP_056464591.1 dopamine receptor D4b [Gadus chalcogrammus]
MSDNSTEWTENNTRIVVALAHNSYNFPALIFGILLTIVITGGNVLVCVSVYLEKALKTTTNYFIVSLAFADLLLAILVLPLFVYTQFQGGVWTLNMVVCDGLMTMDVMLCTASIFNLCAISVDRFIAVSIPLNYNRKHVDHRQIVLLSATWLLALAVASPVMFGINRVPRRDPSECKLEDDNYVIYSSVCSFFIPCPIMLLLYFAMFRGLRRWEESRKAKLKTSIEVCRKLQHAAAAVNAGSVAGAHGNGPTVRGTIPGPLPMPLPRIIERDLAQTRLEEMEDSMEPEIPYPRQYRENSVPTLTYHHQHRKKRAKINGRERKAMRVLPVVVGCFLFCWTPFFVVHTTRAICSTCDIPASLMDIVTWLGYVNSALNPIIYTIFNTEFRKFFKKFLHGFCCHKISLFRG